MNQGRPIKHACGTYVLVQADEFQEETESGIVLLEHHQKAQARYYSATVISIGPEVSKEHDIEYKVGDSVNIADGNGFDASKEGPRYMLVSHIAVIMRAESTLESAGDA